MFLGIKIFLTFFFFFWRMFSESGPLVRITVMWIRASRGSFWCLVKIYILPLDIWSGYFKSQARLKPHPLAHQRQSKCFQCFAIIHVQTGPIQGIKPLFFTTEKDWGVCTCFGRNSCSGAAFADDINTYILSYTPVYGVLQGSPNDRALLSEVL